MRVIFQIKETNILRGGIGVRTVNLKLEGRGKACESGRHLSQERRGKILIVLLLFLLCIGSVFILNLQLCEELFICFLI